METEYRSTDYREAEYWRNAARADPAERGPVSMPGDRLVTTRVASGRTGGAYSLFEVEVGPRGREGPHVQHREDECLYVVEGRFSFAVEGVETEAGPGAHLYVPKGTLHAYENVGGVSGRLLAVHTPGGAQEGFLMAAEEAAAEPVAASVRRGFAALAAEHGVEVCEATQW